MNDSFGIGGTERQFARLAQALNRGQFEVHVGCLKKRGAFLPDVGEVEEFNHGGGFLSRKAFRARNRLFRHLRAHQFQIAHSFDWYANVAMIPIARLAGVPAIIGSHRQLGAWMAPAQFRAQDWAFRLCRRVVCNSEAARAQLRDRGVPERKLVVIPNALPERALNEVVPAFLPSTGCVRVGMVARMNNAVKNYPMLLRAVARLRPRFPHVEFLLVGDGPLRPQLEAMARQLGVAEVVQFLGERQDIPAVLASLDLAVLCSTSESLSNAIIEALASGKPVVATNVGGNPELVRAGETGLLVPSDDDAALANALAFLIEHPELRAAWGKQARTFALQRFGLEEVCRRYQNLYCEAMDESSARHSKSGRRPAAGSQDSLKVVFVGPSTRMIGGQAAQLQTLLELWTADGGLRPSFVPVDPVFPPALAWAERVPALRTVLRAPIYIRALWRGLRHADVAHVFAASYWSFLLAPVPACVLARLRGCRVVLNYHSGEAPDHLRRSWLARAVLRRCDIVAVPSQFLEQVFAEWRIAAAVVPNVVDLDQFRFRTRDPLRPSLLCTRGFGPCYRQDLVVRAFSAVRRVFPSATLCLVGTGSEEVRVRALATELGLKDIEFAGPVTRDGIAPFYDQADIFINASDLDNAPLSILEAFASGMPVVSTSAGGIPFLVQQDVSGLLSPPGDAAALAENVIRLLQTPGQARRLAAAAHLQCDRYSWPQARSAWLQLYRSNG